MYLVSEAILQRRYPLASAIDHVELTPQNIARGAHLVSIAGCTDCHSPDLRGHKLISNRQPQVYSANLVVAAHTMTDEEIERAIRFAVAPDATSLWAMPSASYMYMSGTDSAAIVAFLKSKEPRGSAHSRPHFNLAARWALLTRKITPAFVESADAPASLDLGPRYDGGRYLARIACSECHGTDLNGQGPAEDLNSVAAYSRPEFFDLLRRGLSPHRRNVPEMQRLADVRFHGFADYEIMALFDYLEARAHASPQAIAHAIALRRQREKLLAGS
jgi:mono/diheme cytochrome c family protein